MRSTETLFWWRTTVVEVPDVTPEEAGVQRDRGTHEVRREGRAGSPRGRGFRPAVLPSAPLPLLCVSAVLLVTSSRFAFTFVDSEYYYSRESKSLYILK